MKILAMSRNRKEIRRWLADRTEPIITHIVKICLYNDHVSVNHWKQEVWAILPRISKMSGTNNPPDYNFILKHTWAVEHDSVDVILATVKDAMGDQSITPDAEYEYVYSVCEGYFKLLAEMLSTKRLITSGDVQQYFSKLGL